MTTTLRRRLLLTTAAVGLVVGGGIAAAQDRSTDDTMRSRSSKAVQTQSEKSKYDRGADQNADKTTGQSPSDDQSRSNLAPDKSKASMSNESDADRGRSQHGTNSRAEQKDSTVGEKSKGPNGQSAESNDRKQPSAAQSDQTKPSSAAQTTPSNDRQRSNTATGQKAEPTTAQSNTDRNATSASQNATSPSRDQAHSTDHGQSSTRVSANLQSADKTKLDRAIAKVDIKPVSSANFSVSVGTAVPDTVTLHPLPTEIIAVIPQYRGYDFFVVKDEFVIVGPRTHKVVDIVERGGVRAEATTTTKRKMSLSQKDRSYIRDHVTTPRTSTTGVAPRSERRITIGEDVPESVEIDSFPEEVYREVPAVRSYRYIHSGNDVYLVEPGSRRVIESIGDED
jgi:hypothetical protein